MSKISKREWILLSLVGGTVLILLNVWLLGSVARTLTASSARANAASQSLKSSLPLVQESEHWKKVAVWLESTLPELQDENSARVQLFKEAQDNAKALSIDLRNPQFIELTDGPPAAKIGVDFELRGPWQQVLRAIYDLHQPERFTAVEHLSIQRMGRDEEGLVSATMRLTRYYKSEKDGGS